VTRQSQALLSMAGAALLVLSATSPQWTTTAQATAATTAPPPTDLVWLALGDSYSAGEGLPYVDVVANPDDRTCERATGTSTVGEPSRAYAVAHDQLNLGGEFHLAACTGDITNQWRQRWGELMGSARADLVTMSYGGNNIGFSDVVMQCVGVSIEGGVTALLAGGAGWAFNPGLGCETSEAELRRRVDMLVGNGDNPNEAFGATQTLPDMYREIALEATQPGGHVVVLGYPNLVEESGRWSRWLFEGNRCHRIRRADVGLLRSVGGYLNQQIALAVQAADNRYNGVRFHFVDVSQIYESSTGRHGLCTGEPWLNGLTVGTSGAHSGKIPARLMRSFHPNQLGHDATGSALADVIDDFDWSALVRTASSTELSADFLGTWSGRVSLGTSGSSFPVEVRLRSDGATLYVSSSGCEAELTIIAVRASEVDLAGSFSAGDCIDGGSWTLALRSGQLLYRWFHPNGQRVDEGLLSRGLAELDLNQWPTGAGMSQGPQALYVYLGADLLFPSWVSCTDDDYVCLVGAGTTVYVYTTQPLGRVAEISVGDPDPAQALRSLGATEQQIVELLSVEVG
jgi:hypothetical protein